MTRSLRSVAAAIAALVVTGPALAADDPLEAFPQEAAVVVRLKAPQTTMRSLADFAARADRQFGQTVQAGGLFLGVLIENPTMQGVDQAKDWWLAVFPRPDREPGIVFAVPATDADAMEAAVGERFHFLRHEDYVLYTEDEATAARLERRAEGEGESAAQAIDAASRKVFDAGDLSAFANVERLVATYRAPLDNAREEFLRQLEDFSEIAPPQPGIDFQAIMGLYRTIFEGAFQVLEDARGFTLALAVSNDGVDVEEYATFAADSPTHAFLKKHPGAEITLLEKLPAGAVGYFGAHGDMRELTRWAGEMSAATFADEDEAAEFRKLMDEYAKLNVGAYAFSFSLGAFEGGAFESVALAEVRPADQARDLSRRMSKHMAEAETVGQELTFQPDGEQFNGHSADLLSYHAVVDEEADPFGFQEQMMDFLFGPEGMVSRTVFLPELMVQTTGGGRELMTKALEAAQAPEPAGAAREEAAATRQRLTARSNVVILFDLPGFVGDVLRLIAESEAVPFLPFDPEEIEKLELKRSYTGFSLAVEDQAARVKTYVPLIQAQQIARLVRRITEMAQEPQF